MKIYKYAKGIYLARVKVNGKVRLFQGRDHIEAITKALVELNLLKAGYLNL